ncbi:hypothetical protein GCM10027447_18310 [Glycomyces halotolerans]
MPTPEAAQSSRSSKDNQAPKRVSASARVWSEELRSALTRLARVPQLLIACDYDGTLAPIVTDPSQAQPIPESVSALRTLAKLPQTKVAVVFTQAEAASALASRIYDLRHACPTSWLNAGVPAPDVAAWAGNSVEVLHRHYYNCVAGQLADNQQKITAAEQHQPTSTALKAETA